VAPIFEDINVATDHNSLMMDVMNRVAERHDLKVLFHEKPFAGLNGSGKHNNWSLIASNGVNVFQPSSSARENLQFLTFLVNTVKAIHANAGLLRASIASAGNDHRLGANEAPPAIMSVFLGSDLTAVLDELENNGNIKVDKGENMYMKLGIDKIPQIILDNTDRNRTSPFAFTGNKFEFRAVGSDQNVAEPMTVLNLIVAKQLKEFHKVVTDRVNKGEDKKIAIVNVLRDYIKESKAVRFEGDGYSQDWADEAEKRGLPNVKDTPRALDAYVTPEAKGIFEEFGVMSAIELEARNEIQLENYILKIQIEARLISEIALAQIVPAAVQYQNKLMQNAKGLAEFGLDNSHIKSILEKVNAQIVTIQKNVQGMNDIRGEVNSIEHSREKAIAYCDKIKGTYFDAIREAVDRLEGILDDEAWPLLKYREMLFLR
ncbi:MAG: glutamine synthetase type III, partial [Cytophagia bacterium]|nr:glutamine synthetase type III [Cytophagia bacterium]